MEIRNEPVFRVLRRHLAVGGLDESAWDRLLRQARRAGVLSRLAVRPEFREVEAVAPPRVRDQLVAARMVADHHERTLRWEVDRIRRALAPTGERFVLLKGAAYLLAGLPAAAGRTASDVDLLVPESRIAEVERALVGAGWRTMKLDPYDQRYYRTWMHELPPLRHEGRNTVVDVHHTILPRTSRYRTDARRLLETAVWLDGAVGVLAPEDMVLHAATHLFADGEIAGGVREVVDLDELLRHFGHADPAFWSRLVPRSRELGLARPLYYALRACSRLLETPVPAEIRREAGAGRPAWPATAVMDALAGRALLPETDGGSWVTGAATWLLYARSHWLRMPPGLLTRHLARKTVQRWFGEGIA